MGPRASLVCLLSMLFAVFTPAKAEAPMRVVATTGMIGDTVGQIAGGRVQVFTMMGPGVDPHLFKAARSDILLLLNADIVFYNGLFLEGKLVGALNRVADSGKPVYAVTEKLEQTYLLAAQGSGAHADPHVWMDPVAWKRVAEVIRDRLIEHDPGGRDFYRANADRYLSRLSELNRYGETVLNSIPEEAKVLVTAHDAFSYFGRRYGLSVVGIQGISTESEAGVQDIENTVSLLVSRKIPAVFVESTVSGRNIEALRQGALARGHHVAVGGQLFSDAMGRAGTYRGTYIGMLDHNITTVSRALGGGAPAGGMQEKLALEKE